MSNIIVTPFAGLGLVETTKVVEQQRKNRIEFKIHSLMRELSKLRIRYKLSQLEQYQ